MRARPLLLGHRGSRRGVPENTFAAFDKALLDGCDGFEFDVRLSGDRRGVVCHDPFLQGLEVARSNSEQLSAISSQNLCWLDQVLARYGQRAYLDIELKVRGLEQATLELLGRHPVPRDVVISSFLPEVLCRLAELQAGASARSIQPKLPQKQKGIPGVALGFIFATRLGMRGWERLPVSHLMPRHNLLDQVLLSEFHAAGKRVFAWTVNRERRMRRLAELGVDGLISDDTQLLSRTFTEIP